MCTIFFFLSAMQCQQASILERLGQQEKLLSNMRERLEKIELENVDMKKKIAKLEKYTVKNLHIQATTNEISASAQAIYLPHVKDGKEGILLEHIQLKTTVSENQERLNEGSWHYVWILLKDQDSEAKLMVSTARAVDELAIQDFYARRVSSVWYGHNYDTLANKVGPRLRPFSKMNEFVLMRESMYSGHCPIQGSANEDKYYRIDLSNWVPPTSSRALLAPHVVTGGYPGTNIATFQSGNGGQFLRLSATYHSGGFHSAVITQAWWEVGEKRECHVHVTRGTSDTRTNGGAAVLVNGYWEEN